MKAPFSWPNSSLSSSSAGMAAQLSLTNGLSLRWLFSKRLVATSSLPVPLSPRMSTVESVGATFMIRLSRPRMARLSPMISGKKCRASMRLSAEVTRSNTVVNCSILSIGPVFFRPGFGGRAERRQPARFFEKLLHGPQNKPHHGETGGIRQDADYNDGPEDPGGRIGPLGEAVFSDPEGEERGKYAEAREDERDDDVEADVETGVFHLLAIKVRSHIGRKMARAKKPTTAARQMVRTGAIASESFFVVYSTSVS